MKIKKFVIHFLVFFLALGIFSNAKAISIEPTDSELSNHPGLLTTSYDTSNQLHLNYVIFNGKNNESIRDLNTNKMINTKLNPLFNNPKQSTSERSSFLSPFTYYYFQHYVMSEEHFPESLFIKDVAGNKIFSAVYSENSKHKYIVSWTTQENVKPYKIDIKLPLTVNSIENMIFQPTTNSILAFGGGKGYKIDLGTGKIKQTFTAVKHIKSLELSQNGKWLIVLSNDNNLQILDTEHSFKDVTNIELRNYVLNNQIKKVYFDKLNKLIYLQIDHSEKNDTLSVITFPDFKVKEELSNIYKVEMNENRTILQIDNANTSYFFSTEGFFSEFTSIRINPSNINVGNRNSINLKVEGIKRDSRVVEIPLKDVSFSLTYDDQYGKYSVNQTKQLIPEEVGNATLIATYKGMKAFSPIKPTSDGLNFPLTLGELPFNSKEVYGKTHPNSEVTLTFTEPGTSNILIKTIKSNENGFFNLILSKPFAKKFEVIAKARYRIGEGQEFTSFQVSKSNVNKLNNWKPTISNVKIDPVTDSSPLVKGHTVPFATVTVKSKTKTFVGKADKYGNFIVNIGKESIEKAGIFLKVSIGKTGYLPSKVKSIKVLKDTIPPTVKWTQIGETMIGKTEPYTLVEIFNGSIRMVKKTSDRYGNIKLSKVYYSPYNELFYSATDRNGNKTSYKFIQY